MSNPTFTKDQLDAMTPEMRETALALMAKASTARDVKLTCKVGEKGGVVIRGGGRYPIGSPYASQLIALLENAKSVADFALANWSKLKHRDGENVEGLRQRFEAVAASLPEPTPEPAAVESTDN